MLHIIFACVALAILLHFFGMFMAGFGAMAFVALLGAAWLFFLLRVPQAMTAQERKDALDEARRVAEEYNVEVTEAQLQEQVPSYWRVSPAEILLFVPFQILFKGVNAFIDAAIRHEKQKSEHLRFADDSPYYSRPGAAQVHSEHHALVTHRRA